MSQLSERNFSLGPYSWKPFCLTIQIICFSWTRKTVSDESALIFAGFLLWKLTLNLHAFSDHRKPTLWKVLGVGGWGGYNYGKHSVNWGRCQNLERNLNTTGTTFLFGLLDPSFRTDMYICICDPEPQMISNKTVNHTVTTTNKK